MENTFTHTVRCFDDKLLSQSFVGQQKAIEYANQLSKQGHKIRIYPYRPWRTYMDVLQDRYEKGEINA